MGTMSARYVVSSFLVFIPAYDANRLQLYAMVRRPRRKA